MSKKSKKSSSSSMEDIAIAAVTEPVGAADATVETEEERKARKLARREKKRLAAEQAASTDSDTPMTGSVEDALNEKKDKKKRKAENLSIITSEIEDILSNKKQKTESPTPKTPSTPSTKSALPATPSSAAPKTGNSSMDALLDGAPAIADCDISPDIVEALAKKTPPITHLFPIQAKTFDAIRQGRDVLARAKTGTGKTLAFSLPIVQKLQSEDVEAKRGVLPRGRMPRVLVLAPTRELAKQVTETFECVGTRLASTCVYGGSPYAPMEAAIRRGVDVVVGTCGRIQDLLDKGSLRFDSIRYVIMDEADEMLNMGFADDVEKILQQIPRKDGSPLQTLLFSATVPSWVENVAKKYLRPDRQYIDLVGNQDTRASTDVQHYAIPCHWQERNAVMSEVIQVYGGAKARTIIFTETKKDCNELAMALKMDSQVLHGDIPQAQRENTLKGFRDGKFTCLVATDVAARGIDIAGVELVIQCEPPEKAETYIHRSGRTGRAGMKGVAITFYTPKQLYYIQNIERHAKIKMIRAPLPQKNDIIKSGVEDAMKMIAAVHPDVLPHFLSSAQTLIEDKDPVQIIAACLAQISGHTQPIKQRSLLCSATGFVTVWLQYRATPIRSLSFVWHMIRKYLFEECDDKVKGMRLTADKLGAVFDIPQDQEQLVRDLNISDPKLTITIPTELPPLDDIAVSRPEPRRQSWGRGASGGSRGRGGAGGAGGGRGRGRGGRR